MGRDLVLKRDAEKELRKIPRTDLRYRLRQGDWRIVYEIEDQARLVTVVKIGNRREVYRRRDSRAQVQS